MTQSQSAQLITDPENVAIGHDGTGFFVDTRWEERVTVMVCIAKGVARPMPRAKRVEVRAYCTIEEIVTAVKDAVAEGKRVVGQIPPRARAEAEKWGAYLVW